MSQQHGVKTKNDYVVNGALVNCNCGSKKGVTMVVPSDRGFEIQGGKVAVCTDTSTANFIGNFGICQKTGGPCKSVLLDKWYGSSSNVFYFEQNSQSQLLTMESQLICYKGGVLSFEHSGQNRFADEEKKKLESLEEKIHVIIRNRDEDLILSKSGYADNAPKVLEMMKKVFIDDPKSLSTYNKYPYDFATKVVDSYLPFVFPGLSTNRILSEAYQATIMLSIQQSGGEYIEGETRQENMQEKLVKLHEYCDLACKLAYMIRDGNNAVANYNADLASGNLAAMRAASSYGLWGKWYDTGNGWHRGIDVCPGGNVHAICDGEIIHSDWYYFNVYTSGVGTITYMHLVFGQGENGKSIIDPSNRFVRAGQVIGTQSNKGPVSVPYHTHFEFNMGRYATGTPEWERGNENARPMSNFDGTTGDLLVEIKEGSKFSYNPYPIIERIWNDRLSGQ